MTQQVIIDRGVKFYFGAGMPAALQVLLKDILTALLLLISLEFRTTDLNWFT
ncbi:hypothetical protein [Chlorogloeopsis sp. ULAP02]|uniref:hypothetical protein n=1 Tax=Chlorogloeopsis sp. ULAP02 TaxID=3107926 RepID=UPI003135E66C